MRIILLFVYFLAITSPLQAQDLMPITTGAEQISSYLPALKGKNVGLVVNQTSRLGKCHLVDTLLGLGVHIEKVLAPEHGFRGKADAGEKILDQKDPVTGVPIISLYGKNYKPTSEQLSGLDILVFDIQDVGVRFYTYISTLKYVMEACAENNLQLIVLDRPNPNADYVDGPILDLKHKSIVGSMPIPIVYGLTIGELGLMINGEGWAGKKRCDLKVIKLENYTHSRSYTLPIKPSPNLPNTTSIRLYPSLGLFEGTHISMGRGTYTPFQMIGYPDPIFGDFTFIPKRIDGMSKYPPHKNKTCYGIDLRETADNSRFSLKYLIDFYKKAPNKVDFFNDYFEKLAGNSALREQIKSGLTEAEIRETWQAALSEFKTKRQQYLLY